MLSRAPVAFLWTRMSFDFARRVRGCRAPDRAILALLSSWVARLVMHPTALHCTSTLGEFICLIRGARPPRATMATLFSAVWGQQQACHGRGAWDLLLTARLPRAALAARCTSISGFWSRNRMGSSVSRSTSLTSASKLVRRIHGGGSSGGGGRSTSLCYLGKGQACRPLQINVVRVDEGAEGAEGLAREEVGFGSLQAGQ